MKIPKITILYIKFSRTYSLVACEHECVISHALELCGYCIPWEMPFVVHLIPPNITYQLCDPYQLHCLYSKGTYPSNFFIT